MVYVGKWTIVLENSKIDWSGFSKLNCKGLSIFDSTLEGKQEYYFKKKLISSLQTEKKVNEWTPLINKDGPNLN